jgi:AcrR family transcriptional regulator
MRGPFVQQVSAGPDRRENVLATAVEAFLRYGYRKTSMEDVARAASISRPGLYFLFSSKQELFAAAVERALQQDLQRVAQALGDGAVPLEQRLVDAFDAWTGRYLGAVGGELLAVVEAHREVMTADALDAPRRFAGLVHDAVSAADPARPPRTTDAVVRTMISAAIGVKQQTSSREAFRDGIRVAVELLLHSRGHAV